MSAYGKPQQPEYDARAIQPPPPPAQSQHYTHAQPTYSSYGQYDSAASNARHRALGYEPSAEAQPVLAEQPSYARQFDTEPRVMEYTPNRGTEGSLFTVYLQSQTDLRPVSDSRRFRLLFGSLRCTAAISKCESEEDLYQLTGNVPSNSNTGWIGEERVVVYVVIEDQEGQENGTIEVGTFTYTDLSSRQIYRSSPPRMSTKRKRTAEPAENPAKRLAGQMIRPKSEDFGTYGYGSPGQYPPYTPTSGSERSYAIYSGYGQTEQQASTYRQPHTSPRNFPYSYSSPSDPTQLQPTSSTQPWRHANPVPMRSPIGPTLTSPSGRPGSPHPPLDTAVPKLIRTSTLQQEVQASNQNAASSTAAGVTLSPYTIYPHKAVLKLEGDLDEMARGWSTEEWNVRRRLVQFWRHQDRNTIHASFSAVLPEQRRPDSICISCIYWYEKQTWFVTSVDCIYLLESLISVRFTVEEKNRIRRNLEGFRPMTVSKAKADSENFFKLIMSYPNPKPRNIEKDVKVFPWSILGQALGKIIGKYSASYASTASVIPPTPGSQSYPLGQSGDSAGSGHPEHPARTTSSPSVGDSTTPTASAPPTSLAGSLMQKPLSATSSPIGPSSSSSTSDLSIPLSVAPPPPVSPHNVWQQQHLPTLPAIPTQQSIPPSGPRSSGQWAFLDAPTPSNASNNAHAMFFQRPPLLAEGRESVSGVDTPSHHIPASVP